MANNNTTTILTNAVAFTGEYSAQQVNTILVTIAQHFNAPENEGAAVAKMAAQQFMAEKGCTKHEAIRTIANMALKGGSKNIKSLYIRFCESSGNHPLPVSWLG